MDLSRGKHAVSIEVDHAEYFINCLGLWEGMDKPFHGGKFRKILINRLLLFIACLTIGII